jgi:hypothetical protein
MLANRRQAFAERLPQVREKERALGIGALEKRAADLAAELLRAESESDASAFADARERDLLARLARVRETLDLDRDNPELADARERHRRVAGVMSWRLNEQFPDRLWEAKKNLKTLEAELARARQLNELLAQAQRDEPTRFEKLAARSEQLGRQVQAQLPRIEQLASEQQKIVQEIAVAELLRQKERVDQYAGQARFAVAQIYDRAYVAKDGNAAR